MGTPIKRRGNGGQSMTQDEVPAFDCRRWGVRGILAVAAYNIVGLAAAVNGFFVGSSGLLDIGSICVGGGVLRFVIKVTVEFRPVTAKWSIVGEDGEVVKDVGRRDGGVVRVRSELWSAKSEAPIGRGEKIRVAKVEGLVAWVSRLEESGAP